MVRLDAGLLDHSERPSGFAAPPALAWLAALTPVACLATLPALAAARIRRLLPLGGLPFCGHGVMLAD